MKKETVIAYILTSILFVGGGAYFTGDINTSGWSDSLSTWLSSFKIEQSLETKNSSIKSTKRKNKSNKSTPAKIVDVFNGVNVYDNGRVSNVFGRSTTKDGYNLGLKYQCVEFVKRYYYVYYGHKMPNSYGHAKEFFNHSLASGEYNKDRGLIQFRNKSFDKPHVNDLLIFGGNQYNSFGHVVIVSKVTNDQIEIVQQNPGKNNSSRATIPMLNLDGVWELRAADILGWLRKV